MQLTNIIANMIGTIALIDLIALIIQGSKQLSKIRGDGNHTRQIIALGIIGGLFGVYATMSGVRMSNGTVIAVRDVGPMMAGCLGGPISGLIAGVIAGIHRLLVGMPDITAGSTIPCSVATLLIGLLCGQLYSKFKNKEKRALWAILIAMEMEVLHLILVFIYTWFMSGLSSSINLIIEIAPPFLIANGIAFGLLVYVLDMVEKYKSVEEQEKQVETELDVAKNIQNDMLPSIFPNFTRRKEFTIDASMEPAKEIGGDFYDFFFIDEDHFAFLIADVSGKGVPAALFMVISKTIIKNNVSSFSDLSEAMQKSNIQLCEGNKSGTFVTAWVGVYEISSGLLTYVNAGHNPPLIKRNGKPFEYLRNLSGFFLAGSTKTKYKQYQTHLNAGDRIFLYTDGITEAMNNTNKQYGEERLLQCFSGQYHDKSVSEIIQIVTDDVLKFADGAEQFDDMTMLALIISGEYETITVDATLDKFDELSEFLTNILKKQNKNNDLINKMNLVLDELFSNVVNYSKSKDFKLGVSICANRISMQMVYGGELFDITKVKDPDITLAAKDRPVGGLGLLIVKNTMDNVVYTQEDGLNVITLTKKEGI